MVRDMKNSVTSCKNMHGSSLNVVFGAGGPHFNQFLYLLKTRALKQGGPG